MSSEKLRELLEQKKDVLVLDVRPIEQQNEWYIPGSIHLDAYKSLNEGDMSLLDGVQVTNNTKVITVCAAGRTSQIASDELKKRGIDAYSLEGGMKSWSPAWNTAKMDIQNQEVSIIQVRRTGKGCLSYLIYSGGSAIIIDPSVDPEVYGKLLNDHQLQLEYVLETHTHADHLSRAKMLADRFRAKLLLPNGSKVAFPFTSIGDGAGIQLNAIYLQAISTPGHTYDSTSYLLNESVLFTGDTLFTDSIGRPDLKSSAEEAKLKAGALYNSLKRLFDLNEDIVVLPGHMSKPAPFDGITIQTTLGEAKKNIELTKLEEEAFISEILKRIPPTPENYLQIIESNLLGEPNLNTDLEAGANRCAIN